MNFGQTVTQYRRTVTGQDAYGKDIYSTTAVAFHNVPVWPAGTGTEAMQGQDVLTDTLTMVLPHNTVVSMVDQFVVFSHTYEVTGSPFDWTSPLTGTHGGVQVALKLVTG